MNATKKPSQRKIALTLNRFKRAQVKLIASYKLWPQFMSHYSFFAEFNLHTQSDRRNFLSHMYQVADTVDFAYCEAKAKDFNASYFLVERSKLKQNLIEPLELYREALFIVNLCVEFSMLHRNAFLKGKAL